MTYRNIITVEPGKRGGRPILEQLATGMSTAEILEDFPELQPEDIQATLGFAADRERHIGELHAS